MSDLDLSGQTPEEFKRSVGDLVYMLLARHAGAVFVLRKNGSISSLDPKILDHVPDEEMAKALLEVWEEEEVVTFLQDRDVRKAREGT